MKQARCVKKSFICQEHSYSKNKGATIMIYVCLKFIITQVELLCYVVLLYLLSTLITFPINGNISMNMISICIPGSLGRFTLCEKCPNKEFFLIRIFLFSNWIQENTDQKKLRIWTLFTRCWSYQRATKFRETKRIIT